MSSQEVRPATRSDLVNLSLTPAQIKHLLPSLHAARVVAHANTESYLPGWTDYHRELSRERRDMLDSIIVQIREQL